MIGRLRGTVVDSAGDSVCLDVAGVGYDVTCSSLLLSRLEVGVEAAFPVHTDVREDSIRLFGFDSPAERQVFLLLNRVSGMGPRSSMDVVSNVSVRDLLRAIGSGDVGALMSIKGVGRKKAERIVVELKDLVANMAGERSQGLKSLVTVERDEPGGGARAFSSSDAVSALEVLGFSRKDAEFAVGKALEGKAAVQEVGELVREALKFV